MIGTQHEDVQKLSEMIKDIKVAMLTTAMPDGSLRSRPMAVQQTEFDGDLWFFTGRNTGKVHEIRDNQHVNVSFAEAGDNRYVSITGRAMLVDDRAKAEELWSVAYRAWFPQGLDDPDLTLLKIEVDGAEYWDSSSSTMVHLAGLAKALATGQRYEPGEHKKIGL